MKSKAVIMIIENVKPVFNSVDVWFRTIRHAEGYRICKAMMNENNTELVIPDFSIPDNIRLGVSPL